MVNSLSGTVHGSDIPVFWHLFSLPSRFSETRLLEIVEAACEKKDFECNQLLEQIEDQVETWWFHRYMCIML